MFMTTAKQLQLDRIMGLIYTSQFTVIRFNILRATYWCLQLCHLIIVSQFLIAIFLTEQQITGQKGLIGILYVPASSLYQK